MPTVEGMETTSIAVPLMTKCVGPIFVLEGRNPSQVNTQLSARLASSVRLLWSSIKPETWTWCQMEPHVEKIRFASATNVSRFQFLAKGRTVQRNATTTGCVTIRMNATVILGGLHLTVISNTQIFLKVRL